MGLSLFQKLSRNEWSQLVQQHTDFPRVKHLSEIVSLNDRLSSKDVVEVYGPLVAYLDLYYQKEYEHHQKVQQFFEESGVKPHKVPPFIIGITGSVAVGKSTTARLLHYLLQQYYPELQIDYMTTDGFLYPNDELEKRHLMQRKGFPESYNMNALVSFMRDVKVSNEPIQYPIYSHTIYDIIPDEFGYINCPDILIIEGINVLQLPQNQDIYMSDFFDFSIYVDAEQSHIRQWYIERFDMHMDLAQNDPSNYYYEMSQWPRHQAHQYARDVWREINLVNLTEHIFPTRERANIIIHKTFQHFVDAIFVRKY